MKFYGYREDNDSDTPEVLTEVTLVASPTTLRQLADFLLHTANLMEQHGPRFGHEHFAPQGRDQPAFIVAREEQLSRRAREMYTTLRITTNATHRDSLRQLGEQMNLKRAGVFSGLRRAGDGFSCEVSSRPSWDAHVQELHGFLHDFAETIAQARQLGAAVTVDVAIEPEDRFANGAPLVLSVAPSLLAEMSTLGLRWELSVY